jgi:hypothetical protein
MRNRDGVFDQVLAILTKDPTPHDRRLRRQVLEPITRGLSWKAKHAVCKQHHNLLSQREQMFIYDLRAKWWKREYLSEKQTKWLNAIFDRLVFEHGVRYRTSWED